MSESIAFEDVEKLMNKYAINVRDYWTKQDIAIYHGCSVRVVDDIVKMRGFPKAGMKVGMNSCRGKVWDRRKVCNYLSQMTLTG